MIPSARITKVRRLALVSSLAICLVSEVAAAPREPDAQGWSGSGWYVTSGVYPGAPSEDTPSAPPYVLFSGPYQLQMGCIEVRRRQSSPTGVCRFLELKPPAFLG